MRVVPRHWHTETWICSMRGHVTPAATVATLRRGTDDTLGLDEGEFRLVRCLRCDAWTAVAEPAVTGPAVTSETLPERAELPKPRRGKLLEDAVLLRLIAIDRAVHAVLFTLIAIAIGFVRNRLVGWQAGARNLVDNLTNLVTDTGRDSSRDWLVRQLDKVAGFHGEGLRVLFITAVAYAVVEGTEAVGLWLERRWAEYLTVLATAGFLPFEIDELTKRVTVLRVGALVLNVAVLVWLVWSKRLFGLRGGEAALHDGTDWDAILATPGGPGR